MRPTRSRTAATTPAVPTAPSGDASGGASGSEALHEDGGSVRISYELSATDLTQLAACNDVDLDLTEKESDRLARARGACATCEMAFGRSSRLSREGKCVRVT